MNYFGAINSSRFDDRRSYSNSPAESPPLTFNYNRTGGASSSNDGMLPTPSRPSFNFNRPFPNSSAQHPPLPFNGQWDTSRNNDGMLPTPSSFKRPFPNSLAKDLPLPFNGQGNSRNDGMLPTHRPGHFSINSGPSSRSMPRAQKGQEFNSSRCNLQGTGNSYCGQPMTQPHQFQFGNQSNRSHHQNQRCFPSTNQTIQQKNKRKQKNQFCSNDMFATSVYNDNNVDSSIFPFYNYSPRDDDNQPMIDQYQSRRGQGFQSGRGGYGAGWSKSYDKRRKKKQRLEKGEPPKETKEGFDKRDIPENYVFFCDVCECGARTEEEYKEHVDAHEKCSYSNCPYAASHRRVTYHISKYHLTGLHSKIWNKNSEEDIKKWREDRKKYYPLTSNLQTKELRSYFGDLLGRMYGIKGRKKDCVFNQAIWNRKAKEYFKKLKDKEDFNRVSGKKGKKLKGKKDKRRVPPKQGNTVFIKGMGVQEEMLRKYFSRFGNIVNLTMERTSNAFITFEHTESADQAIAEAHDTRMEKIKLCVKMAFRQPLFEKLEDGTFFFSYDSIGGTMGKRRRELVEGTTPEGNCAMEAFEIKKENPHTQQRENAEICEDDSDDESSSDEDLSDDGEESDVPDDCQYSSWQEDMRSSHKHGHSDTICKAEEAEESNVTDNCQFSSWQEDMRSGHKHGHGDTIWKVEEAEESNVPDDCQFSSWQEDMRSSHKHGHGDTIWKVEEAEESNVPDDCQYSSWQEDMRSSHKHGHGDTIWKVEEAEESNVPDDCQYSSWQEDMRSSHKHGHGDTICKAEESEEAEESNVTDDCQFSSWQEDMRSSHKHGHGDTICKAEEAEESNAQLEEVR